MAFGITAFAEAPFAASGAQSTTAIITGQSLTTNIESVTTLAGAIVSQNGLNAQVLIGEETPRTDVSVITTGLSLQTTLGTVEALRLQGVTASTGVGTVDIQAGSNVFVNATENGLQTGIGQAIEIITVDVFVDGVSATINIGEETPQANADVVATALSLSTAIDGVTIDLNTPVDVTGEEINTFVGEETPSGNADVSVTGSQLTLSIGDVDAVTKAEVTGQELSSSIGSVTVTANSDINLTGISMTSSIGTVNVTAWQEIDTGVSNVWTEVDLAA